MLNRSVASAVEDVARRLIPQHHPHLEKHSVPIAWRFRDDEPQRNGQPTWYSVKIIKGDALFELQEAGAEVGDAGLVVVYVSEPVWGGMSPQQQEAMVDEILCGLHAGVNEKTDDLVIKRIDPDVHCYYANLERHGYWHDGVRALVKALESSTGQGVLALEEDAQEAAGVFPEGEEPITRGLTVINGGEPVPDPEPQGRPRKRSKLQEWQEAHSTAPN